MQKQYTHTRTSQGMPNTSSSENVDNRREQYSVALFLGFQMMITSVMIGCVVWIHSENRLVGLEAFAWVYNDSRHWFWPTLLSVALGSLLTMYVICRLPFAGSLKKNNLCISGMLLFVYLLFSTCWLLLFMSLAGSAICDPVVRILNSNTNKWEQWPHSQIEVALDLQEREIEQDVEPELRGVCLANTPYTKRGQKLVTLSVSICLVSYAVLGIFSIVFQRSSKHPFFVGFHTVMAANAILTFGIGFVVQIVLDDEEWDWRVFNGLLTSFLVSSFCVSSILFFNAEKLLKALVTESHIQGLHMTYGRGLWVYHLVWIYVQILYDIENAIYEGVLEPYSSSNSMPKKSGFFA